MVDPVAAHDELNAFRKFGSPLVIAGLGDSMTAHAYSQTSISSQYQGGYLNWLTILSNQRYRLPPANIFAVPGDTTTVMLSRVGAVIAARPDICFVLGGQNDLIGDPTLLNLQQIYQGLTSAGIVVVALTIIPGNPPNGLSGNAAKKAQQINQMIRRYSLTNVWGNFLYIDLDFVFADPMQASWLAKTPNYTFAIDGVHPSWGLGAYMIAKYINSVLGSMFAPDFYVPVVSNGTGYDPVYTPNGNLLSNGAFLGTGGSTDASIAGTIATDWRAQTAFGTKDPNVTFTGSVVTLPDGRSAQQIAITYSGALAANESVQQIAIRPPTANINPGDTVEFLVYAEITMTGNSGIWGIAPFIQSAEGDDTHFRTAWVSDKPPVDSHQTWPTESFKGIWRTPPHTFSTYSPSYLACGINFGTLAAGTAAPASTTLKFASAEMHKV